jgi:hypothetical protein
MTFVLPTNQTSQQRSTCYIHLKNLLAGQQVDRAIAYAKKHQVADSIETIHEYLHACEEERKARQEDHQRAAAARQLNAYRRSQECADTEALIPTFDVIPQYGDWPEETEVMVVEPCLNPRLVKVRLPDGREASLWRAGIRNIREGMKYQARIETFRGEANPEVIYERIFA